jgi:hypothetical protein
MESIVTTPDLCSIADPSVFFEGTILPYLNNVITQPAAIATVIHWGFLTLKNLFSEGYSPKAAKLV